MELLYFIANPFINFYHRFVDYNDEIYMARKYVRMILRGEDPSEEQFDAWLKYRFHPAILNHK